MAGSKATAAAGGEGAPAGQGQGQGAAPRGSAGRRARAGQGAATTPAARPGRGTGTAPAPASGAAGQGARAAPRPVGAPLRWQGPRQRGGAQEWLAPEDGHRLGARVAALPHRGVERYYAYRRGGYLGSDGRLEDAKLRAQCMLMSERPAFEEFGDTGFPALIVLTAEERAAAMENLDPKVRAVVERQREAALQGLSPAALDQAARGHNPEQGDREARRAEKQAKLDERAARKNAAVAAGAGRTSLQAVADRCAKESGRKVRKRDVRAALAANKQKAMSQFPDGRVDDVVALVLAHVEKKGVAS
jgi:hypothetical protein